MSKIKYVVQNLSKQIEQIFLKIWYIIGFLEQEAKRDLEMAIFIIIIF